MGFNRTGVSEVDVALNDLDADRDRDKKRVPLTGGQLAAGAITSRSDVTLKAHQSVVVWTGRTTKSVTLPPANALGAGVSILAVVVNQGAARLMVRTNAGDVISASPTGKELGVERGHSVLLISDGMSGWGVHLIGSSESDHVRSQAAPNGAETWYWANQGGNAALAGAALTAAQLYAMPFIAPKRLARIDRLGFNVTALVAASNAKVGLYDNVGGTDNPYPGSLLFDSGDIGTGATGVKTATLSLPLAPGALYWIVLHNSAAISVQCLAVGGVAPLLGTDNALGATSICGLQNAQAYAALPGTFPAGSANIVAAPIPALARRYSA